MHFKRTISWATAWGPCIDRKLCPDREALFIGPVFEPTTHQFRPFPQADQTVARRRRAFGSAPPAVPYHQDEFLWRPIHLNVHIRVSASVLGDVRRSNPKVLIGAAQASTAAGTETRTGLSEATAAARVIPARGIGASGLPIFAPGANTGAVRR
jgi:hypothetical protein